MSNNRKQMHSKPLLPRSVDSRPENGAPDLHPLLVKRAHGCLHVAFINLVHKLTHGLLGLRGCRVRRDGAC